MTSAARRFPSAVVTFGAQTDRRWLVPVAVWMSLPVVWINSWVILLAVIRLRQRQAPASFRAEPR